MEMNDNMSVNIYDKETGELIQIAGNANSVIITVGTNGELLLANGVAGGEYRCTFSYPVAEQ